jgi:hypothetical protein
MSLNWVLKLGAFTMTCIGFLPILVEQTMSNSINCVTACQQNIYFRLSPTSETNWNFLFSGRQFDKKSKDKTPWVRERESSLFADLLMPRVNKVTDQSFWWGNKRKLKRWNKQSFEWRWNVTERVKVHVEKVSTFVLKQDKFLSLRWFQSRNLNIVGEFIRNFSLFRFIQWSTSSLDSFVSLNHYLFNDICNNKISNAIRNIAVSQIENELIL